MSLTDLTLLVVDDDTANLESLRRIFEREGRACSRPPAGAQRWTSAASSASPWW
jgi:CheY-like chemotaxis protein